MYKFDSSYQWVWAAPSDNKATTLAFQQSSPDCESFSEGSSGLGVQRVNPRAKQNSKYNIEELDSEEILTKPLSERHLEQLLSNLLKYGVFLASAIVFVGGVLYLIRHGASPADYQVFRGEPSEFRSPEGIVKAVLSGSRRGVIQFGLLVLIATPMIRVAISLLFFLRQRDCIYVIVTFLVMSGLIYSVIGAYY